MIVRNIKDENVFEYSKFSEALYDVRYSLAKSRLMDTSLDKMQEHLIGHFKEFDKGTTGKIHLLDIQRALLKSKKLTLTPF